MRILVARDEAFNFIYRANIDALRGVGEVTFFSPLHDALLPQCDLLYLPGGYPELFLNEIRANSRMCKAILSYAQQGGRIFAECGGFMYLCRAIDGVAMCGVFPFEATMDGARLHLGYRQLPLHLGGDESLVVRGHEFHYSSIREQTENDVVEVTGQLSAQGKPVSTAFYRRWRVVAGYTHWYWADLPLKRLLEWLYNGD